MPRQPMTLVAAVAVVMSVSLLAGGQAQVHGDPVARHPSVPPVIAPPPIIVGDPMPVASTAAMGSLDERIQQASADAANNGATISTMVLDRRTGTTASKGSGDPLPLASVAKLFIADDLLFQNAKDQVPPSPDDLRALEAMLRSSDDSAAEVFWGRNGGNAIISRVAARYGLASLAPPYDGRWCNTIGTAADLVRYYAMLLDGSGGLPMDKANIIIGNLSLSTPEGVDGYPQRFGIPDGLSGERVAVKQGWMCCWDGGNWMHLSTGVIGPDNRYVMVIGALQPSDDATARTMITQTVKMIFPLGRIS